MIDLRIIPGVQRGARHILIRDYGNIRIHQVLFSFDVVSLNLENLVLRAFEQIPQVLVDQAGYDVLLGQFYFVFDNVIVEKHGLDAERGILVTLQPLGPQRLHFLLHFVHFVFPVKLLEHFDGVGLDLVAVNVHFLVEKPCRFQYLHTLLLQSFVLEVYRRSRIAGVLRLGLDNFSFLI